MAKAEPSHSLDPVDWAELRRTGHAMLDDMLDHLATVADRPLWQPPSPAALAELREELPERPSELGAVHATFMRSVLPYGSGNAHPGFMGWVQGGGTAVGMLADMLAAGMNANCGGRHHAAIELERQVLDWSREIFRFPMGSSGLLVGGTSIANFIAVLVARTRALGRAARREGLLARGEQLTAYTSAAAHGCIARAMDMAGFGTGQLRLVPVDADQRMQLGALRAAIEGDRAGGRRPFLIVGTAGTVDTGAIDDLAALADLAASEDLHFHVDGAFGALAVLVPELAPRLAGLERADSLAFDWHKWGQVPYDCGCILVRDAALHRDSFAAEAAYLARADRGLAAGEWWPCDYGPDLSRGFRALKLWFTLKTYGIDAIGRVIAGSVALARRLAARIEAEPELELLAPAGLNIVCFGYRSPAAELNAHIVADLHEAGRVAPSLTTLACGRPLSQRPAPPGFEDRRTAIRAAIVNHRTREKDVDLLVEEVLRLGRDARRSRAA